MLLQDMALLGFHVMNLRFHMFHIVAYYIPIWLVGPHKMVADLYLTAKRPSTKPVAGSCQGDRALGDAPDCDNHGNAGREFKKNQTNRFGW